VNFFFFAVSKSLFLTDFRINTPIDWVKGKDVVVDPAVSDEEAKVRDAIQKLSV
jgi:hypothetical protein